MFYAYCTLYILSLSIIQSCFVQLFEHCMHVKRWTQTPAWKACTVWVSEINDNRWISRELEKFCIRKMFRVWLEEECVWISWVTYLFHILKFLNWLAFQTDEWFCQRAVVNYFNYFCKDFQNLISVQFKEREENELLDHLMSEITSNQFHLKTFFYLFQMHMLMELESAWMVYLILGK